MKKIIALLIVVLAISGCSKIKYGYDGIGYKKTYQKPTGYGRISIIQNIDTSHYFGDTDIVKTEIWLGDEENPQIFSFGNIIKEAPAGSTYSIENEEYQNALKQAKLIRQKLINGGMVITGNDESITDERNWLSANKTFDLSADFSN